MDRAIIPAKTALAVMSCVILLIVVIYLVAKFEVTKKTIAEQRAQTQAPGTEYNYVKDQALIQKLPTQGPEIWFKPHNLDNKATFDIEDSGQPQDKKDDRLEKIRQTDIVEY